MKSKALYTLDQSADANKDIFGISEGLLEAGLAIYLESISTHRNQNMVERIWLKQKIQYVWYTCFLYRPSLQCQSCLCEMSFWIFVLGMEVCSGGRPLEYSFSGMVLSCKCSFPAYIYIYPTYILIASLLLYIPPWPLRADPSTHPFVFPLTLVKFTQPLKPCPSLFGVVCLFVCLLNFWFS